MTGETINYKTWKLLLLIGNGILVLFIELISVQTLFSNYTLLRRVDLMEILILALSAPLFYYSNFLSYGIFIDILTKIEIKYKAQCKMLGSLIALPQFANILMLILAMRIDDQFSH